ncbi:MBL fold metallo-hydrolase [Paenibacillus antibioticophila]|uniref:MBL fold metallo-hydrolase n=1 Tax=Paenibacillus antibioticophila TaxID=1274374 RepID=A0A920CH95_9BACL|nr:MBL fold metallo-hydrolase [Paenibacillus antibioticophila]GIO40196.1 MBL fold metallo-hydrolase [Paenibacillus antibioticophila]
MIDIKPLGSSSAGNAYRITDGHTPLLLECGLRFKDLQRRLNYQLSNMAGCLLTHNHQDHCKSALDMMQSGIDVYASAGTLVAAGLSGHRAIPIQARKQFTLGTWTVLPFEVEHDVDEPLGFLLANRAGEKLLFATDTYYIRYKFSGLTHLLIECNYSEGIVERNILETKDENVRRDLIIRRKRLRRSHFSLENMKDFLRESDMSRVEEIWLIHLSDSNSDAELFKREIQALTGCPVYVADR